MKPLQFRTFLKLAAVLAMLSPASPLLAQQNAVAPASPPAAASHPAPAAAPVATSPTTPQPIPMPSDVGGTGSDNAGKALKGVATSLRDLSPWSMFMSADIIVKAVMIGLAFASLVTWTIFIAKMIELSIPHRQL